MTKRPVRILLALALVCCNRQQPLRIAVVGGSGSPVAAELAVEDINAAGGINGRRLELGIREESHETLPADAIAIAESLSADLHVLAVIGHAGSGTSLAASQVYNARHVPQIAPNTSSPLFSDAGPYSFRLVSSDEYQAKFIASSIAAISPQPRVAVHYVNDDYGRALHGFLRTALRASQSRLVYDAPFLEGASFAGTMDELLHSVTAAKPGLFVWIGRPEELQLLRPKLHRALPHLRVLGSDGVGLIRSTPAGGPFDGDWLVSYVDLTADRPALRRVASLFEARAARPFTDAAALTYDAVGILAEALRSGARGREGIQRYLQASAASGRVYDGITGAISFDENGDAKPSYVLYEITPTGLRPVTR